MDATNERANDLNTTNITFHFVLLDIYVSALLLPLRREIQIVSFFYFLIHSVLHPRPWQDVEMIFKDDAKQSFSDFSLGFFIYFKKYATRRSLGKYSSSAVGYVVFFLIS